MIELIQNINPNQFVILLLIGLMLLSGGTVFLFDKLVPHKKQYRQN